MEQLWLKHPMHLLFILIIRHFLQVTIFNLHLYWSNQNIPLYLLIFYLRFWPLRIFSLTCCGGTFALREIGPPANLLGITFLEAWSDLDCHHLVCVLMCECVCVCVWVYVCMCMSFMCVCVSVSHRTLFFVALRGVCTAVRILTRGALALTHVLRLRGMTSAFIAVTGGVANVASVCPS